MRVLVMTKIFPNALEPHSSPFNRQQFSELARLCDVEILATIPWFPGARLFSRWSPAGRLVTVPHKDVISGLPVRHPRFFFLPKWGHSFAGLSYVASLLPYAAASKNRIDVILGSWAYPDGFAAVVLGKLLGLPSVIKLHGSDMNVIATMAGPRRNLAWALPRASRIVAVSRALAQKAIDLGAPAGRVEVVPNGVDGALFFPREQASARRSLGLGPADKIILYVGRLEQPKGVLDLLEAFTALAERRPEAHLVLLGEGAARAASEAQAAGLPGRIRVLGARPLEEVPIWIAASDVVTLPSWNEGTPNCLLEALACGRPVVATRTGGIPDVVHSSVLGELVPVGDPASLASALERVAWANHDQKTIRQLGFRAGWNESAARLHQALLRAVER